MRRRSIEKITKTGNPIGEIEVQAYENRTIPQ